ncbi:MAG: hypothetical protein ABIR27_04765, partial [Dokdonella sp.]
MKSSQYVIKLAFAALALMWVPHAMAAQPAKAGKLVDTKAAPVNSREIEYASLVDKIGSTLVIHTTNGTIRRGTLMRYTNVSISLKLGPDNGSIELAVPRATIRKLSIEI